MSVVTGSGGGGGAGGGGDNGKVEAWDSGESMGRKKKKSKDGGERKKAGGGREDGLGGDDDDDSVGVKESGCWVRLRFIGSCISSRSKVDSSISGTSTNYVKRASEFCQCCCCTMGGSLEAEANMRSFVIFMEIRTVESLFPFYLDWNEEIMRPNIVSPLMRMKIMEIERKEKKRHLTEQASAPSELDR